MQNLFSFGIIHLEDSRLVQGREGYSIGSGLPKRSNVQHPGTLPTKFCTVPFVVSSRRMVHLLENQS